MTAPLGSRTCVVLGCLRDRHTSPAGLRYSRCLKHTLAALTNAFGGSPSSTGLGVSPRALDSGARRGTTTVSRPTAA